MTGNWHRVVKRKADGPHLVVSTDAGDTLRLHRFAVVGKNNHISRRKDGTILAFAKRAKQPEVPIHPAWTKQLTVSVLGRSIDIVVKEIENHIELLTRT